MAENVVKVVLFCGGRGSATIIRELLRWPSIRLVLLVNAYDDGLSTGALRDFIPGMLGPSDFRKNLSYLLDLYSNEQYVLKTLIEYRIPLTFGSNDLKSFREFVVHGRTRDIDAQLGDLLERLDSHSSGRIRRLLRVFLDYADQTGRTFDFRDCCLGNLIYAGAYLECDNNFNAATAEMSHLVSSQAVIVNVSNGENLVLAGLKADGQLLSTETEIVGSQSDVPILETFFMSSPIKSDEWATISGETVANKLHWLKAREEHPALSREAHQALIEADIIVYGPGTQHSSLLPSYRIAAEAIRSAPAPVKAFVMNLGPDHDIQKLAADELVDRALHYMGDPTNSSSAITHIVYNHDPVNGLIFRSDLNASGNVYRNASVLTGEFRNVVSGKVHNGYRIVREIMSIWGNGGVCRQKPSLHAFVDLYNRSTALDGFLEEFIEISSQNNFSEICLQVDGVPVGELPLPLNVRVESSNIGGVFPEVQVVLEWLQKGSSDYLVTMTGDGAYSFRDVVLGVSILEELMFGTLYGSRTQSRRQFNTSLRAAYGEKGLLFFISFLGAFLLSLLFSLRFGIIFSDPLTGLRIYQRRQVQCLRTLDVNDRLTPTSLTKCLVRSNVEIAELPVRYRTFSGFTDPRWRLQRGVLNLLGIFR